MSVGHPVKSSAKSSRNMFLQIKCDLKVANSKNQALIQHFTRQSCFGRLVSLAFSLRNF